MVAAGNAVKLTGGSRGVALLRDSVVQSRIGRRRPHGRRRHLRAGVRPPRRPCPGDVALRNVTALSTAGDAIRCSLRLGRGTMVNVIARGPLDVNANNGSRCSASHSNLRPDRTSNLALGEGIQSGDPLFTADGFCRWPSRRPSTPASTTRSSARQDPDGRERTVPDIGPFECCTAGASTRHADHDRSPPAVAAPAETPAPVVATAEAGKQRGRLPRHRPRARPGPGRPVPAPRRADPATGRHGRRHHRRADHARHRARPPAARRAASSGAGASRSRQGRRATA